MPPFVPPTIDLVSKIPLVKNHTVEETSGSLSKRVDANCEVKSNAREVTDSSAKVAPASSAKLQPTPPKSKPQLNGATPVAPWKTAGVIARLKKIRNRNTLPNYKKGEPNPYYRVVHAKPVVVRAGPELSSREVRELPVASVLKQLDTTNIKITTEDGTISNFTRIKIDGGYVSRISTSNGARLLEHVVPPGKGKTYYQDFGAAIRTGPDMDSSPVGGIGDIGSYFEAEERVINRNGMMRLKLSDGRGYVSEYSQSGEMLAKLLVSEKDQFAAAFEIATATAIQKHMALSRDKKTSRAEKKMQAEEEKRLKSFIGQTKSKSKASSYEWTDFNGSKIVGKVPKDRQFEHDVVVMIEIFDGLRSEGRGNIPMGVLPVFFESIGQTNIGRDECLSLYRDAMVAKNEDIDIGTLQKWILDEAENKGGKLKRTPFLFNANPRTLAKQTRLAKVIFEENLSTRKIQEQRIRSLNMAS